MARSRLSCGSHGPPWVLQKARPRAPVGTTLVAVWWSYSDPFGAWRPSHWDRILANSASGWRPSEAWKKRFTIRSLTNMKALSACVTTSKSMKKHWVFLIFSRKPCVLLSKIGVFRFYGRPGEPDDHLKFCRPKKTLNNLAFLILFFDVWVRGQHRRVQK